ncbi:MAG: DinB family protein [Saprospirales bacterium]|nr:MAG: DinB family protein [Saprospirales bacterium]
MKIDASELINELVNDTRSIVTTVEREFSNLSEEDLLMKPDGKSWSVGECLEHLSLYSDYYHPAILRAMKDTGPGKTKVVFESGRVGNFFAKSMLPKEKGFKMGSPSDKNPSKVGVPDQVVKRFLNHQKEMLRLLAMARDHDLNKIKVPISISKWIKFRLGDTFRFVINHNQRHIIQAVKASESNRQGR